MVGMELAPDSAVEAASTTDDLTDAETGVSSVSPGSNGLATDSALLRSIPLEAVPPVSDGRLFLQPLLNPHEVKSLEELYSKLPGYFGAEERLRILRAYLVVSRPA